jgi:glucokinase
MREPTSTRIGAVDIGGSKIAVAVVSGQGLVLSRKEFPTEPELGFARALIRIERSLQEVIEERGPLHGIGVGCPGPLDPLSGTIFDVGTLPGWNGAPLAGALESLFGVKVAVENDADAAALAEYHWGEGNGAKSFLYVTVSTGIGGGIVLDGKLYRGVHGAHPELGHQIIDSAGPECYCGARGCWEGLASGIALSAWMQMIAPHQGATTAENICQQAIAGDENALGAVRRQAYYLGLGLANLVTLFTPEKIALGGGVMKSHALYMGEIKRVVAKFCTQVPAEKVSIGCASLGADVGVLGAAQAWLQRFA